MEPEPISRARLRALSAASSRIDQLDEMIEWIQRDLAQAEGWGRSTRSAFGANRLHAGPEDALLGRVVALAIADWALARRGNLVALIAGQIEVRDPPDCRALRSAAAEADAHG